MKQTSLSPVMAFLLGLPISLFVSALLCDVAYYRTFEVQWINFAAWLIAGALILTGLFVIVALIGAFRVRIHRHGYLFFFLIAAMSILGFWNALVHARDGWATMPTGLILSAVVALVAIGAAWAGLSGSRQAEER